MQQWTSTVRAMTHARAVMMSTYRAAQNEHAWVHDSKLSDIQIFQITQTYGSVNIHVLTSRQIIEL